MFSVEILVFSAERLVHSVQCLVRAREGETDEKRARDARSK